MYYVAIACSVISMNIIHVLGDLILFRASGIDVVVNDVVNVY